MNYLISKFYIVHQILQKQKGMPKYIFPNYDKNTGMVSKKASLDKYAQECLMIIWENKKRIIKAIQKIDKDAKITFRYTLTKLSNIKRVKLKDCWGQADETGIDIAYSNMSESFLLGTILHEALHNVAFHKDKTPFTEEEDHKFMRILGEIC